MIPTPLIRAMNDKPRFFVDESDSEKESSFIHSSTADTAPQSNGDIKEADFDLFESEITSIVPEITHKAVLSLFDKFKFQRDLVLLSVNEFFDNRQSYSEVESPKKTKSPGVTETKKSQDSSEGVTEIKKLEQKLFDLTQKKENKWYRYIGSFAVDAWATRPHFGHLSYGLNLNVSRSSLNASTARLKAPVKSSKRQKTNFDNSTLVRLTLTDPCNREFQKEIGRLPEDIGKHLCSLIDFGVVKFEGYIIFNEHKRLSIGDSFLVQLDAYISSDALKPFTSKGLVGESRTLREFHENTRNLENSQKSHTFDPTKETEMEELTRRRQEGLKWLFGKVELTSTDEAAISSSNTAETAIALDSDDEIEDSKPADKTPEDDHLNLNQLKEIYKSTHSFEKDQELPETFPPQATFSLDLREYQRKGLSWLLKRERENNLIGRKGNEDQISSTQIDNFINNQEDGILHPLWKEYKWPQDSSFKSKLCSDEPTQFQSDFFYYNMYSGEFCFNKPVIRSACRGGILADEMGLGKTISIFSLIFSCPRDSSTVSTDDLPYADRTTLVVVPMSLLSQWESEFHKSSKDPRAKCYVYYGGDTLGDLSQLLSGEDAPTVVLTTFGTLQAEWSRMTTVDADPGSFKVGLYSVKFHRVVVDEAHNIRNRNAKTSKALYAVHSFKRWALTGTPIVNRLDDLFSLIKYLRVEPWDNFPIWRHFITRPFEQKTSINQSFDVLKSILEPIVLRRTKNDKDAHGNPLVVLPPKEVVIERLRFNEKEQIQYEWFKNKVATSFKEISSNGNLLSKFSTILTYILRLRQLCCHLDLVNTTGDTMGETDQGVMAPFVDSKENHELSKFEEHQRDHQMDVEEQIKVKNEIYAHFDGANFADTECSICTTSPIEIDGCVITECKHLFCAECLMDHFNFQVDHGQHIIQCPVCRREISKSRLLKTKEANNQHGFSLSVFNPFGDSSKISALIKNLNQLHEAESKEQCVVFSQFSSFLDLIEKDLKRHGKFRVFKFDGRLNMQERQKVLKDFANSVTSHKVSVLLLSLKAGGVGLNLTNASRAFMMDPWWSPSVEDQAIDRIHRIGQEQNVKVIRFIMENSIEEKMLKIQERKKQLGEAVGADDDERRQRRIEEIQLLFSDEM